MRCSSFRDRRCSGRSAGSDPTDAAAKEVSFEVPLFGYGPVGIGIVADAVHTLHDAMSPSSHSPSEAAVNTGTAFPPAKDTET